MVNLYNFLPPFFTAYHDSLYYSYTLGIQNAINLLQGLRSRRYQLNIHIQLLLRADNNTRSFDQVVFIHIILNFYSLVHTTILVPLLLVLLGLYHSELSIYTSVLDILSRIDTLDFVLNKYYYWWTSFWYIPCFIFSLVWILKCFSVMTSYTSGIS